MNQSIAMKLRAGFGLLLLFSTATVSAEQYNLAKLHQDDGLLLFNRRIVPVNGQANGVIQLDANSGDGLAWIRDIQFSTGTIEVELQGKNQPGRSFVGCAFHGQDNETFDAVYLRPFNFRAPQPESQSHSIQYVSVPEYEWSRLRSEFPNKYESAITPAPDPESWVKLKLVVDKKRVSAFINGAKTPSLTVELISGRSVGKVGLWVGNGSAGMFRNLIISPDGTGKTSP